MVYSELTRCGNPGKAEPGKNWREIPSRNKAVKKLINAPAKAGKPDSAVLSQKKLCVSM
jgi:hypothetical protein